MRVEDGRVTTTADGETEIAKCRWMATNSYTDLDPAFKRAYPVDIESVKAYGPPSARLRTSNEAGYGPWRRNYT